MWLILERGDGEPLLLNVGNALAIKRGKEGEAVAISLVGYEFPLGRSFEDVAADLDDMFAAVDDEAAARDEAATGEEGET